MERVDRALDDRGSEDPDEDDEDEDDEEPEDGRGLDRADRGRLARSLGRADDQTLRETVREVAELLLECVEIRNAHESPSR